VRHILLVPPAPLHVLVDGAVGEVHSGCSVDGGGAGVDLAQHTVAGRSHLGVGGGQQFVRLVPKRFCDVVLDLWYIATIPADGRWTVYFNL